MTEQAKKTLKDVLPDIERYFAEDCYCPNEVYSVDGFGYRLVYADTPCEVVGEFPLKDDEKVTLVKTMSGKASDKKRYAILMNVWHKAGRVTSAERYDLSEDNIKNMVAYWNGECDHVTLTEADRLAQETMELLSMCNAVIV